MTRGPAPEAVLADRIRDALAHRDFDLLNRLALFAGLTGQAESFERITREELAVLPHELHAWWQTPCNCTGQLN